MTTSCSLTRYRLALCAAALSALAGPFAADAGTVDPTGTDWSLHGKARIAGVARSGRRAFPFRDTTESQVDASFTTATDFTAHDYAGWDYSGTYARARGRFRVTLDEASEAEFDAMLSSWLSAIAEESGTADAVEAPVFAKIIRSSRITVTITRRFHATSESARASGVYRMRLRGS